MERAEKLAVSSPAPPQTAAAPASPRLGPAAVLALQRSAGNAAVTARLSRTPAFDPGLVVSALRQAIDQVRIRDRWTVDKDDKALHATARHVDVAAVVRELEVLTPEQIQLVKIRYQAEAVTTLENDLLGAGRSASPANLTDAEGERIYALLRGAGHKAGTEAPEALLDAVAAELHGLAAGELDEPRRERLMALYRAHGTEMEPAYEHHYGHAPAADLRGKLSARQQLRLDALRAGDVARADALAIGDKRAAIDALDRRHAAGGLSLAEPWYAKRRGELSDDAVALATDSAREAMAEDPDAPAARVAHERLAGAPADQARVVEALSGGRLIEAQARKLVDLEARHKTDTEHVQALMGELHDAAVHDTLAGLPAAQRGALRDDKDRLNALAAATAQRYTGLLAVMYDGLRPSGGRTWAAILASAKQPEMLAATAAAGGELDPVDELHFAIERKDATAIRHVLDTHAEHAQLVELNIGYLSRYHLDLKHAIFGATGERVALEQESPMMPSASAVRGHDAAAALERLDTPKPGGADEVKWIVASAEREVRTEKAGGGLTGKLVDTETERMMDVTLAGIRMLADRWTKHQSDETLEELRAARARLRVDAGGYEADMERFRGQIRGAITLAVQGALALMPGVGEGIIGFLATTVVNTSANALANRIIQGDDYNLDMLYDDVVGGLAGAVGGKLGGEAVGLLKGGRAVSREALDLAAKQITGETAQEAIALAKAAGRTTKLADEAAKASNWAAAGKAGLKALEHVGSTAGTMGATRLATGHEQLTLDNLAQAAIFGGIGHAFGHADPKVVTDESMRAGDAKVHYTAERPGAVEDVHVRVAPGTDARVVAEHVAAGQAVQRFKGLSGVLNTLYEQARAFVSRQPAALPGTRAYEVRRELDKLQGAVARGLHEIATGQGDEAQIENLAGQIDHYRAELAEITADPAKGLQRGRGWIAALSPESFAELRSLAGARFAEADAAHTGKGPRPSERYERALRTLEGAGLGEPGRALITQMFEPAFPSTALSQDAFEKALRRVERAATVVTKNPGLVKLVGLISSYHSIIEVKEAVLAAYERGETIEGRPIRDPGDPELASEIEAMKMEAADFDAQPTADPVERLLALMKLRDQVARAMEVLRVHDPSFTAVTGFKAAGPSDLLAGVREQEITVVATGRVGEPLARELPGMGLELTLDTPSDLARVKTKPKELGEQLATLLAGYQRAHLIGPGFGGELLQGIMLAPADMNLGAQNRGVERFIRKSKNAGVELTLKVQATGRRLLVPLDGGGVLHVEVLTKVEYEITSRAGVMRRVAIEVSPPPKGHATVTTTEVPGGAPGGNQLLDRLAPAQDDAIDRPTTSASRNAGSSAR